ncbi:hypothetical protein [uncultured Methylibium sp.]|uniref:hypothetical protein n=1 Tax=uncultured Methylibium sp. TaxID=381093 RepID=UPI0025F08513|nr:hypothetical protein [uncultured Methylibium sp.]
MSNSVRWVIRGIRGRVPANFNWGIISARSIVHVSAAEVRFGTTQVNPQPPLQNFFYNLGAADIWVSNISPHRNEFSGQPGGVSFIVHVGWNSPLDVAVTITVEDALPVEIQGY